MPALHGSLKQDHVLEGPPAHLSPGLVGLDGGYEGRHEAGHEIRKRCDSILHSELIDGAYDYALCQHCLGITTERPR